MRQRPAACLALLVFLVLRLLPLGFFYEPQKAAEKCEAQVTGQVSRQIRKDDQTQIYLRDCQVQCKDIQFDTGQMLVYLKDPTEYPVGTDLSLSGTIYPIEEPTNPGQFNSRLYYGGKGISYTFYAEKAQIVGIHPALAKNALLSLRGRLEKVYEQVLSEKDSGLIKAMILGAKEGLDAETKELYQKNGISHLLAISGLHLSLVGMGLYRLLRRLSGSYLASGIPAVMFLAAYGWMTGGSISTFRAAMMCSLAILADLIGRTYDMLTAIGVSALILMFTNPLCVRQSAFLLSYGAVTAIALISPVWKLYKEKSGRIGEGLTVSLSVLFMTFPLLLLFFYEYPLYSTLLNLLVIPLMSVLMVCGILCGILGMFCLPASRFFGFLCHLILSFYEWTGKRCLSLPGAVLPVGSPARWKVLLYYVTLCTGLIFLYREKRRKKYWRKKEEYRPKRMVLAGTAGSLLICALLLCLRVSSGLAITMLDVGQGDGVFFRTPTGITCLYDGGSTNVKQVGAYRILPFLKWSGVKTLDYIFVSHMDQDHINGLKELIEESGAPGGISIGHAVLPALQEKDEAYQEMEELLSAAKISVLYLGTGDMLKSGECNFTCLWPDKEAVSDDRNDLSMVMLAEYGEFQMLLTGDIGEDTEKKLAALGVLREAEVLKTAHHGSRYSSTEAFLQKVRPVVSLISCSASNRYGHPGEETLQRLADAGSRIYLTKEDGAIRVWTDGKRVKVSGFLSGDDP